LDNHPALKEEDTAIANGDEEGQDSAEPEEREEDDDDDGKPLSEQDSPLAEESSPNNHKCRVTHPSSSRRTTIIECPQAVWK
jgi:hypothetical protein